MTEAMTPKKQWFVEARNKIYLNRRFRRILYTVQRVILIIKNNKNNKIIRIIRRINYV